MFWRKLRVHKKLWSNTSYQPLEMLFVQNTNLQHYLENNLVHIQGIWDKNVLLTSFSVIIIYIYILASLTIIYISKALFTANSAVILHGSTCIGMRVSGLNILPFTAEFTKSTRGWRSPCDQHPCGGSWKTTYCDWWMAWTGNMKRNAEFYNYMETCHTNISKFTGS